MCVDVCVFVCVWMYVNVMNYKQNQILLLQTNAGLAYNVYHTVAHTNTHAHTDAQM